ncbi:MAG: nitroreductase family protein [Demequinaceae bacterium]|nr:nitroreductase family protein [Demequinaceae bacterium]
MKRLKRLAKRLLAIRFIRRIYNGVTRVMLAFGGSNRVTATVYSWLGWFTHNREQYAVLSGRRAYYRNLGKPRPSHVELRRNIHRLEKGLLMQPARDAFARDYIGETVEFYSRALSRPDSMVGIDLGEIQWAHDVLARFFSVTSTIDSVIAKARADYAALPVPSSPGDLYPKPVSKLEKTDITYDQMLHLALNRRSVRWFLDKPVSRDLIDKAMVVARQSPSACNRLPYEFLVFDDPEMVAKVAGIPFGASGYSHQIPTVIVIKGDLSSYFSPRDRHIPYIDASLAAMSFIFALETLGLSASPINWPDFEPLEAKMAKTLHLKPYERVIMLLAVGYADPKGAVGSSRKKDLDTLRRYNALEI